MGEGVKTSRYQIRRSDIGGAAPQQLRSTNRKPINMVYVPV